MESRLVELETRCAYQEHTLVELNDVIVDLRRHLETLENEVKQLREQAEKGSLDIGPGNDRPPHW